MKKRHKRNFVAFLVGYLGATCLMIYVIYTRGLEVNFLRLFVFPVGMGALLTLAAWQMDAHRRMYRREREDFRRRGWNWKAYRITFFVLAVLVACVMAILGF